MVTSEFFGKLSDGRDVTKFRITNCKGESVELLDYGAAIYAINVLNRDGELGDVVLGARDAASLETCRYNGAIIGRVANRIKGGHYVIDGKEYQLEVNSGTNFLHGGSGNYAKRSFDAEVSEAENAVTFRLYDDIDVGYGCNVDVTVRYAFSDDSKLTLDFEMTAEGNTVINPTNHTYFDLTAGRGDIRDCRLMINASYIPTRDGDTPNGGKLDVTGTPADFRAKRLIREAVESDDGTYFTGSFAPGYDEFFMLDKKGFGLAAEATAPDGRTLRVYTDLPSVVLFCTPKFGQQEGKNGRTNGGWNFFCIESGYLPNAVNCPEYDSNVFRKDETLRARTVYEFSVEE